MRPWLCVLQYAQWWLCCCWLLDLDIISERKRRDACSEAECFTPPPPPPGTVRRAAWQPPHGAAGRKFTCSLCRGVVFPDCWRCHDIYARPCCSFGHRIHFLDERCRRYAVDAHFSTRVIGMDSFCSAGCLLNHKCFEEQPRRTYIEFPPVCDADGMPIVKFSRCLTTPWMHSAVAFR